MAIDFLCPHCNQHLRVEDREKGLPAGCPNCGGLLRVPAASTIAEVAALPGANLPGRNDNREFFATAESRSGMVTAVAIVNLVVGGLSLGCGTCLAGTIPLVWADVQRQLGELANQPGMITLPMFLTLVGITAALGLLEVFSGAGVYQRKRWGRWLCLISGGFNGVLGMFCCVRLDPSGLLHLSYATFIFSVLLQARYASEFS